MKSLRVVSLFILIAACAPIRVAYDFEKGTNFTQYNTYNYYSDIETGFNELDSNRLLNALDNAMQGKGLVLSDKPDFYINIQGSEFIVDNRNTVGVGVGGGGRNVGGGISIGIPIGSSNVNRQIIIEFIEEGGDGLFWQAVGECNFNLSASPENREVRFKQIVDKMLSKYPPN